MRSRSFVRGMVLVLALPACSHGMPPTNNDTSSDLTTVTTPTTVESTLNVESVVTAPTDGRLRVHWVGGSEFVLEDVSMPAVARVDTPTSGGCEIIHSAIHGIAPTPETTLGWVQQALSEGTQAMILSVNVSWLYRRECASVAPPHSRYACLLAPADDTTLERNAVPIRGLFGTVVDSRIPTVVVVISHSTDALTDPTLTSLIHDAESTLLDLVPNAPNIHVIWGLTVGRSGFAEGDGFYDMVHPTASGAERLAAIIMAAAETWWSEIGLTA